MFKAIERKLHIFWDRSLEYIWGRSLKLNALSLDYSRIAPLSISTTDEHYGYVAPHCDSRVLHAPGICTYCDWFPEWQKARAMQGIAFTGDIPTAEQILCPSESRRTLREIEMWRGNRPYRRES